jgi:hypothetical protein
MVLADEAEDMIKIPTLHVIGCNDPLIAGSMALYNVCDGDTSVLLDHGKGHTIPREPEVVKLICEAIGQLIDGVNS